MHEWYLTRELISNVLARAQENGINKVTRVKVELGTGSHLTSDSLQFCFQVLSQQTAAEAAILDISESEGEFLSLLSLEGE